VILSFEDLKKYRKQVAMVDGAFDPLHRGHIEYFRAAAERLDVPLLCNVASDGYVRTTHPPLLPQDHRAAVEDASDGIIGTHVYAPVVQQKGIGYLAKTRQGILILITDRLIRQVAAGHHQRAFQVFEKQMMQRRVGQHPAKRPYAGRNGVGNT